MLHDNYQNVGFPHCDECSMPLGSDLNQVTATLSKFVENTVDQ